MEARIVYVRLHGTMAASCGPTYCSRGYSYNPRRLHHEGIHWENTTIQTDTAVDSVLREEASNELRATGVVTQLLDGSSKTVDATKEIVVSGAAYCSSAIMMRGSREELVQFNIDGKIDLPGVGEPDGLSDHFYLLRDRKGRPDKLLASYHKSNRAKAYMQ
ncbi:uncharacterized protein AKAW2_20761S [Aspergillus luchuensis]|uniref:Glucose-methanol-choline oxidoreductase N-terminal domain-containing protein n=1 Tax=Aspergillus kawachii TaxID=1069201 RepID=A0A7R7W3W9_ASPKA|nr:uncharacterized protein AKAW2_20761S [Aspergillus luchuensis]BCR95821.1 hypothetical protein AKAW2_20761S [Aspergillus luchuensis]